MIAKARVLIDPKVRAIRVTRSGHGGLAWRSVEGSKDEYFSTNAPQTRWYCMTPEGCTCPRSDDRTDTKEITVAITGGLSGGIVELESIPADEVCGTPPTKPTPTPSVKAGVPQECNRLPSLARTILNEDVPSLEVTRPRRDLPPRLEGQRSQRSPSGYVCTLWLRKTHFTVRLHVDDPAIGQPVKYDTCEDIGNGYCSALLIGGHAYYVGRAGAGVDWAPSEPAPREEQERKLIRLIEALTVDNLSADRLTLG